jgi:uncharacterized protein YbgA (DUF1722 family)/uncharacterized protein YbbK (DUF523 family)
MGKIPLGVSQCLLGERVRFDGGHKHSRYLTEVLADFVEFRPVCPEVAIGLGVPRKPIRLVAIDSGVRVLGVENPELDVTDALIAQAELAVTQMPDICGYVFMQKSPSCGLYGIKRYRTNGYTMDTQGRGAYAQRFVELMPHLPVEEAGRLNDVGLRDNFLARVFAYHDFKVHLSQEPTAKKLIEFYSRYKYQVMAHHVPSYFEIGRFLSNLAGRDIQRSCDQFFALFMKALSFHATRKGNTNALMHLRGYLKGILSNCDKQELSQLIDAYKAGMVPLVVPLTLLKHHLLKLDNPYLKSQTFWAPHPERLGLRNHIVEQSE